MDNEFSIVLKPGSVPVTKDNAEQVYYSTVKRLAGTLPVADLVFVLSAYESQLIDLGFLSAARAEEVEVAALKDFEEERNGEACCNACA